MGNTKIRSPKGLKPISQLVELPYGGQTRKVNGWIFGMSGNTYFLHNLDLSSLDLNFT